LLLPTSSSPSKKNSARLVALALFQFDIF
jgi:hypothetical protein